MNKYEEMPVGVGAGKKVSTLHSMMNNQERGEMGRCVIA